MADATYAMTKVLQPGGTAYGQGLSGRPAAGKTGTTDNNTNAWFTGFTPQLCTSVWIGNVDRNQTVTAGGVGEVFGGTLPAEVWQQMMNAALAGQPRAVPFPADVRASARPMASSTATPTRRRHRPTPRHRPRRSRRPSRAPTMTPTATPPPISPTPTDAATPPSSPSRSPCPLVGAAVTDPDRFRRKTASVPPTPRLARTLRSRARAS